ncbi:MAG: bifunctional ADP-dependent NAD(P)H-hydrate dehydratase/NAD(P)H-hydrate epimerase [Actinomycetota bacterium]|nr:bifunctional ADP-dependent NAD(P)H-hydrate dehydratase/NAD(P)H-hydrate epimerase [Actinomycetota bacterium]
MRRAYAVEQIRHAEQALMATLPDGALMQRAASGLAAACADLLGRTYGARVLVVAGSGNNGGDAMYAGAMLARRGAAVEALLLEPARAHSGGLDALQRAGGRVVERVDRTDLALDGIVGIGGTPGLGPEAAEVVAELERRRTSVVAVDVPSGVEVDTGRLDGPHVHADVTVTFGADKVGLLVGPATHAAGHVHRVDIGLAPYLPAAAVRALQAPDVAAQLAAAVPAPDAHKYTRGVVGVAAGSPGYTGAGLLCVAGAVSGLAGMVRFTGGAEVADLVRTRFPEVIVGEGRVQAWVVGSGGGGGAEVALRRALDAGVPVVVDADALQHLPARFDVPALVTPHAGELARLLDVERGDVEGDPLRHARAAARRWQATVLLKGDRTLVADPDGECFVNTSSTPWLATAGAGDVLAGLCGALLATLGCSPLRAGAVAAWLHGSAATLASGGGPVVAGDVAAALPAVIRDVLTRDDGDDES